jgi:membrane dipeptidase
VYPHERNIPDDLIQRCAATGGVVGINGLGDFLGPGDDMVEWMVRHIDHVVQQVGPQHVGLGLDFVYDQQEILDYLEKMRDTFSETHVNQFTCRFAPPETFVPLTARLLHMGYSRTDLEAILGGNWYRVARQVWHG